MWAKDFRQSKWRIAHKNGQRKVLKKMIFFHEEDRRFSLRIIHKSAFLIGQVPIKKKYGLKIFYFASWRDK